MSTTNIPLTTVSWFFYYTIRHFHFKKDIIYPSLQLSLIHKFFVLEANLSWNSKSSGMSVRMENEEKLCFCTCFMPRRHNKWKDGVSVLHYDNNCDLNLLEHLYKLQFNHCQTFIKPFHFLLCTSTFLLSYTSLQFTISNHYKLSQFS